MPPQDVVIRGLTVEALAAYWEALGLACTTEISAFPDSPVLFYEMTCERSDAVGDVIYRSSAIYWRTDSVSFVDATVIAVDDGSVEDGAAAPNLFGPTTALVGGSEVEAWVLGHVDDPACGGRPGYCQRVVDQVAYTLSVGSHGARQLEIERAQYVR